MMLAADAREIPLRDKGRFMSGHRYSQVTEFQKGQHWRPRKPWWDRSWLYHHYVILEKPASQIAAEQRCGQNNILFWLKKHDIPRRTMSEIRKRKHWGAVGEANPMHGKRGASNPNWKGGTTPLRQSLYASEGWKMVSRAVRRRDKKCRLCESANRLEIHHITPFHAAPLLALEQSNLILLCCDCHIKVQRNWKRWRHRLEELIVRRQPC